MATRVGRCGCSLRRGTGFDGCARDGGAGFVGNLTIDFRSFPPVPMFPGREMRPGAPLPYSLDEACVKYSLLLDPLQRDARHDASVVVPFKGRNRAPAVL